MATKKPTPKKAASKPTAKKPIAKPAPKKAAAKPAPKKVAAKPTAKKPIAKPAPKKVAAKKSAPVTKKVVVKPTPKKVESKKVVAKPAPKKVVAKPAPKKAIVKAVVKPTAKKVEVKKPVAKKIAEKKVAKVKEVKIKPVKEPKVKVVKEKPVKVPKVKAPKPIKKPANTKTIIASTYTMPKKSDVFKTSTFATSTLKNETGKVIAHRKTSELKRKAVDTNIKKYEPEQTRSILDMNPSTAAASYRYSDDDLQEFKELILQKLEVAKTELQYLQGVIMRKDEGGTEDTENKYQGIEDGSAAMDREQFTQLASRQITFISHLEQALMRIENKTYGICRETGKLIDKARLRAVPHATLSIEAKNAKKN